MPEPVDLGRQYSSTNNVSAFVVDRTQESFVPELSGFRGLRQFQKMSITDDTVGAMLWAVETTLGQLGWSHEPRMNGEPSTDPQALEAAKFANTLLADMSHSYQEHTESASSMLWAGFFLAEINYKRRQGAKIDQNGNTSRFTDGLWGVANLSEINQLSVSGWNYANSRAIEVKRMGAGGEVVIPLPKCVHYRIKGSEQTPAGRSLFTNAHRSWFLKSDLQDAEAIGIRRELCGLPMASVPKVDMDLAQSARAKRKQNLQPTQDETLADARISAMIAAATKMRFNETAGLVSPSDVYADADGKPSNVRQYEFKIMTSGGQRAISPRDGIRDYDRSIARVAMMQFLHLGDRSTGSYALSDNQSTLALRSIKALTGKNTSEWDQKVLPTIWALNAMDPTYLPGLQSTAITEDSLAAIGTFLEALSTAETLLEDNPSLKTAMFGRLGVQDAPGDLVPHGLDDNGGDGGEG